MPAADGQPRYVLDISPVTNTVTVGPREALAVRQITGIRPTWTQGPTDRAWSGGPDPRPRGAAAGHRVRTIDDDLEVVLDRPGHAGSPRARPSCSTTAPGSSAARPSQRPPRELDPPPIRSTGIGSWPGTDMADAIKIAFAECPDLPYLPELPARGAHAAMIGRSTALLAGLAVDLQPAGWRLTDGSGRDHRLAISTLRSDLDLLEEHAQGYAGPAQVLRRRTVDAGGDDGAAAR